MDFKAFVLVRVSIVLIKYYEQKQLRKGFFSSMNHLTMDLMEEKCEQELRAEAETENWVGEWSRGCRGVLITGLLTKHLHTPQDHEPRGGTALKGLVPPPSIINGKYVTEASSHTMEHCCY